MAIYRVPVEIKNASMPSSAFNVWHVRMAAAGDDPGPAVAAIYNWYATIAGNLANGSTVVFPDSLVEVTTQEEKSLASVPAPISDGSTTAAPMGMAYCISWKTSLRARRGRGRTFLGPLTPVWAADGQPGPTFINNLTTACQTLVDASTSNVNGWAVGVWGRQTANVATAHVLRDITGFTLSSKFSHLRSRRD